MQRCHRELYFSSLVCMLDTNTIDNCLCRTGATKTISGPAVESKRAEGQKGGSSLGEECLGMPWGYQLPHTTAVISDPHGKARSFAGSFQSGVWGRTPAGHTGHQGQASRTTLSIWFLWRLGASGPGGGWSTTNSTPCPAHTSHPPVTNVGNYQPPC